MAQQITWQNYSCVKINLYICRKIYNELKNGNRLHSSFECEEQKTKSRKRKKAHMTFEFVMGLGAPNSNRARRVFGKGNTKLREDEIMELSNKLAISEEYFKIGTKKQLDVPGITPDDWKFLFKRRYKNNINNVSLVGNIDAVDEAIKQFADTNIFANYGPETEFYRIFWYYLKGETYKVDTTADKVKKILEELNKLNYNDWIECKENLDDYVKIMCEQIKVINSMKVLESHFVKMKKNNIEIKKI